MENSYRGHRQGSVSTRRHKVTRLSIKAEKNEWLSLQCNSIAI